MVSRSGRPVSSCAGSITARYHVGDTPMDLQAADGAGARGVHSLGLSGAALQALLDSYTKSIDRVMYLGVGLAAGALVFCWGLGWHNILEITKPKLRTG